VTRAGAVTLAVLVACGGARPGWPVPAGWRTETFAFPIEFAPALHHRGVEELRFAPGMFEPGSPGYWSYAFVWRLDDAAELTPEALAAELTAYYVGLEKALDDKHAIEHPEATRVAVHQDAGGFAVDVQMFVVAKEAARPLELTGEAVRRACSDGGSLWVFALAPATTGVRPQLGRLVETAACGQPAAK
jgi:hypothetical protein